MGVIVISRINPKPTQRRTDHFCLEPRARFSELERTYRKALSSCCLMRMLVTMTVRFLLVLSLSLLYMTIVSFAFAPAFTSHEHARINNGILGYRSFPSPLLFSSSNQQEPIPRPGDRPPPPGGDMAYIKRNIDRQYSQYTQIREVGGVECVTDVYAKSLKQPTTFWFAGKVARCTGVCYYMYCDC